MCPPSPSRRGVGGVAMASGFTRRPVRPAASSMGTACPRGRARPLLWSNGRQSGLWRRPLPPPFTGRERGSAEVAPFRGRRRARDGCPLSPSRGGEGGVAMASGIARRRVGRAASDAATVRLRGWARPLLWSNGRRSGLWRRPCHPHFTGWERGSGKQGGCHALVFRGGAEGTGITRKPFSRTSPPRSTSQARTGVLPQRPLVGRSHPCRRRGPRPFCDAERGDRKPARIAPG